MKVSIMVAYAHNRVIGKDNQLPWRLPRDLKRFKEKTFGHYMLMGRKTYESLDAPLPGRTSVVITRNPGYQVPAEAHVVSSIEVGLEIAHQAGETEAFVIGGEEIFRLALERQLVDCMYLTVIDSLIEGDAFFPDFNLTQWEEISRMHWEADEKNPYPFDFIDLQKRR
jgi:dihydrofolate reductase